MSAAVLFAWLLASLGGSGSLLVLLGTSDLLLLDLKVLPELASHCLLTLQAQLLSVKVVQKVLCAVLGRSRIFS